MFFTTLEPSSLFAGRYRVVRGIKAGGMGAVYEVIDERTQGRRALKVLLPNALEDADLRDRSLREATFTAQIDSDHIVRVFDAGIERAAGTPFIVMELLDGEDLSSLVKRRGPLPHEEVLRYLHQIAFGLDKAHGRGIVHRDLKPENIFITRSDEGEPRLKILDFGIAKAVMPEAEAKTTRTMGTPKYMSPEQIRGSKKINHRADLYALGHVAYALLAGEAYWTEESGSAESIYILFTNIIMGTREAPVARALRREGVTLPPAFDSWFLTATAVDPAARFANASGCIAALRAALVDGTTPSSLPSLVVYDHENPPTDHGAPESTVLTAIPDSAPKRMSPPRLDTHPAVPTSQLPAAVEPSPVLAEDDVARTRPTMVSDLAAAPSRRRNARTGPLAAIGFTACVVAMMAWNVLPGRKPGTDLATSASTVVAATGFPTAAMATTEKAEPAPPVPSGTSASIAATSSSLRQAKGPLPPAGRASARVPRSGKAPLPAASMAMPSSVPPPSALPTRPD